jgi:hypothetical protein
MENLALVCVGIWSAECIIHLSSLALRRTHYSVGATAVQIHDG